MSLTPVLADAFALPDITQAAAVYPKLRVMVMKSRRDNETRYRGVITDGKYGYTTIFNSSPAADAQALTAGDVIEVTKYSLHFANVSRDPGSPVHPITRIHAFTVVSHQDETSVHPSGKFSIETLNSIRAAAGSTAPAAPASAPAAPAPAPAPEQAKRSYDTSSASAAGPQAKRQKVKTQPIEAIFPLAVGWKIRARASRKGQLRSFKNERNEGKLFNVIFLDESGEIQAKAFGEEAVKFHDLIQDGHMYYISNARVDPANKKFSNVKNDYELYLQRSTIIEPCEDDDSNIPEVNYDFCNLEKLQDLENGKFADVIGVIQKVGEHSKIISKNTGRPYDKRDVGVVDKTGFAVDITLWGKEAAEFSGQESDVVAVKGARVGAFNNRKNLSTLSSSLVTINPNIKEAHALKGWYDAQGHDQEFKVIESETGASAQKTEIKLIKQVIDERIGANGDAAYFTIHASVLRVFSKGLAYPACTSDGCQKKVIQETNGDWSCEKCGSTMSAPNYRYTSKIMVGDGCNSEGMRLSFFDETAKVIFGRPAGEIVEMQNDESVLNDFLKTLAGQEYIIRCRARLDSYNGQEAVQYQALSIKPFADDVEADTRRLLEEMGLSN